MEIWIVFCAIFPASYAQVISNKPSDNQTWCPGDEITFTCETIGSQIIAWSSAEYIGANRIEFGAIISRVGEQTSSQDYDTTVASLTRNEMNGDGRVLESRLRIMVRSNISSPTVTCVRDNGAADPVTLRVLVAPGRFHIVSDQRKNSVGGCVVHFSWAPPSDLATSDISHFKLAINGTLMNDERNINKRFAMRAHPVCPCGTHNISIVTVNRCNVEGENVTEIVNYPESDSVVCEATSTDGSVSPPNIDNMGCENKSPTGLLKGLIIACLLLLVSVITALILAIMLILVCCGYITPKCGKEKNNQVGNGDNLNLTPSSGSSDKANPPSSASSDKEKESQLTE